MSTLCLLKGLKFCYSFSDMDVNVLQLNPKFITLTSKSLFNLKLNKLCSTEFKKMALVQILLYFFSIN